MDIEKLKYPIGPYKKLEETTPLILNDWINTISLFPQRLKNEVIKLSDAQLDTPYRPNGWTIRQVVHHCADSHINSLIRFKLALTEENPIIKPYSENRWAELNDSTLAPIEPSLKILEGVHFRWTALLQHLTTEQLKRTFIHPEHGKTFNLEEIIGVYAWHCNHHLAHITELKKRNSWE